MVPQVGASNNQMFPLMYLFTYVQTTGTKVVLKERLSIFNEKECPVSAELSCLQMCYKNYGKLKVNVALFRCITRNILNTVYSTYSESREEPSLACNRITKPLLLKIIIYYRFGLGCCCMSIPA